MIITATGIQMQALGGITVSIDGEKVNPHDRFVFRRHLLEDVPNAAWCIGYTNASWTLGADLTARSVAKLLAYMDSHGYTHAYPHLGERAHARTARLQPAGGLCAAVAGRDAEVGHPHGRGR